MKPLRRLASYVLWAISNATGQWAWDLDPDVEELREIVKRGALRGEAESRGLLWVVQIHRLAWIESRRGRR